MALGDCPDDDALRDAWDRFCEQLRGAGEQAFKDYNPSNGPQRADAFRFLTQNLGQAFDLALETRNTAYPQLHRFCSPNRKLGCDAADRSYRQAWIDGEHRYRVSGNTGTARFLNFTLQGARPETQPGTGWPSLHEPFGDIPGGRHDLGTAFQVVTGSIKLITQEAADTNAFAVLVNDQVHSGAATCSPASATSRVIRERTGGTGDVDVSVLVDADGLAGRGTTAVTLDPTRVWIFTPRAGEARPSGDHQCSNHPCPQDS